MAQSARQFRHRTNVAPPRSQPNQKSSQFNYKISPHSKLAKLPEMIRPINISNLENKVTHTRGNFDPTKDVNKIKFKIRHLLIMNSVSWSSYLRQPWDDLSRKLQTCRIAKFGVTSALESLHSFGTVYYQSLSSCYFLRL